jgi:hypothetical protein
MMGVTVYKALRLAHYLPGTFFAHILQCEEPLIHSVKMDGRAIDEDRGKSSL